MSESECSQVFEVPGWQLLEVCTSERIINEAGVATHPRWQTINQMTSGLPV
jgi:hypothetical protein